MVCNPRMICALGIVILLSAASARLWLSSSRTSRCRAFMKSFSFRAIAPARQNGRVLHVVVNEKDPTTINIAPSTAGSWRLSITARPSRLYSRPEHGADRACGHSPIRPNVLWVGTRRRGIGPHPCCAGFASWKSVDAGNNLDPHGLTETRPHRAPSRFTSKDPRSRSTSRRSIPLLLQLGEGPVQRRECGKDLGKKAVHFRTRSAWWTWSSIAESEHRIHGHL